MKREDDLSTRRAITGVLVLIVLAVVAFALRESDPAGSFWDDWLLLEVQVVGLFFLAVYVWKTWEMASAAQESVRASEEARLEAMAPRIVVYFDPTEVFVASIVTENAGTGTAADVTYTFDPPLESSEGEKTARYFDGVKSIIPPGVRLPHWFATWPEYLNSDLPQRYSVTVKYRGAENGKSYEVVHVLDTESVRHRLTVHKKGLHELVGTVEKKSDELHREVRAIKSLLESDSHYRGLFPSEAATSASALSALEALWHVFKKGHETAGVYMPDQQMIRGLSGRAYALVEAQQKAGYPTERVEAAAELLMATLHYYRRGDEAWLSRVEVALEKIRAYGDQGAGEGEDSA